MVILINYSALGHIKMSEKEEERVLGKVTRKLYKVGDSVVISVPPEYLRAHSLKIGDKMDIYFNEALHAEPVKRADILKKLGESEE